MMTRGARWRRRRNLVLALASVQGVSLRFLGDVYDLDHSRVCRIVRELRAELGTGGKLTAEDIRRAIVAGNDRPRKALDHPTSRLR